MSRFSHRPLTTLALCALLASTSLGACAATTIDIGFGNSASRVSGSGHMVEQTRALGSFTRLRLDGSMTVNARPGSSNTATVRADDNIVPLIVTAVEGDTLVIKTQPDASFYTRSPVVVTLSFSQLNQADLRGSGDLNIAALRSNRFEISLAGSGDVRLDATEVGQLASRLAGSGDIWIKGKADEASFSIAGSGDVHANDLVAARVNVSIAGSGDARVQATDTLDVRIAGSGDVTYSGQPKVKSRVAGSGDIRPAR